MLTALNADDNIALLEQAATEPGLLSCDTGSIQLEAANAALCRTLLGVGSNAYLYLALLEHSVAAE